MAMTETSAPSSSVWLDRCTEAVHKAISNLTELVDGPEQGARAQLIRDPILWVHTQFDLFRTVMPDNDGRIVALARIEHDFIAALCALNFGDQRKQCMRRL